ncbi:MAG TPA: hypothetical protein VG454_06705 [Gemmatimonadales bacterium]|nr:hypothetical protein [Gemmatimonadales bacterium]
MPRRIGTDRRSFFLYHRGMRFPRRVYAEVLGLAPRLLRTRFGAALLLLALILIWLESRGLDPRTTVLQSGALSAVIGAAWVAGNARDRAALATALTHPTTPLAIATGRWMAVVLPAALLTTLCTAITGTPVSAAAAGVLTAAAVGAFALAIVLALGSGAAITLFLFMAIAGAVAPEQLVGLAHPGMARLAAASALELGPALWHYRDVATGDWAAMLHAFAWTGLGILFASAVVARHRTDD